MQSDLTPFITKHFSESHTFLQESVALLVGEHATQPATAQSQQDPCARGATLSLATRVAGIIRLQAGVPYATHHKRAW